MKKEIKTLEVSEIEKIKKDIIGLRSVLAQHYELIQGPRVRFIREEEKEMRDTIDRVDTLAAKVESFERRIGSELNIFERRVNSVIRETNKTKDLLENILRNLEKSLQNQKKSFISRLLNK